MCSRSQRQDPSPRDAKAAPQWREHLKEYDTKPELAYVDRVHGRRGVCRDFGRIAGYQNFVDRISLVEFALRSAAPVLRSRRSMIFDVDLAYTKMRLHSALTLAALLVCVVSMPVRRSPSGEMEARRRSAIDRSVVRFGRSYPPKATAADLREAFQRTTRRGNAFLRFGRSQPATLTTDDLISLIKYYNEGEEQEPLYKRSTSFIRLGRDPSFIRFGRSQQERESPEESELGDATPPRKNRARDYFLRLGRGEEDLSDLEEEESRKKRSAECTECRA
ncbi:FMRFamide-related peptides [Eumeta japonica]|uniref:FMRFamide-related peptides n=1 Tax=Eumeta variegata TaxID=151549 RepID=A0A4C1TUT2_EUMVA|nr:FMRFamide-related peptides [Eumeta japonica]